MGGFLSVPLRPAGPCPPHLLQQLQEEGALRGSGAGCFRPTGHGAEGAHYHQRPHRGCCTFRARTATGSPPALSWVRPNAQTRVRAQSLLAANASDWSLGLSLRRTCLDLCLFAGTFGKVPWRPPQEPCDPVLLHQNPYVATDLDSDRDSDRASVPRDPGSDPGAGVYELPDYSLGTSNYTLGRRST